jgi:predicted transposase/invertase (TIGR01784 family)
LAALKKLNEFYNESFYFKMIQFIPRVNYMFRNFLGLKVNRLSQSPFGLEADKLFQNTFTSSAFSPKEQLKKVALITPNTKKTWIGGFSTSEGMKKTDSNYINPCYDPVFKQLFNVESNIHLLKSLINSVIAPEKRVTELILLNSNVHRPSLDGKACVMDVKARSSTGEYYNVEMQLRNDDGSYEVRAMYYWAELFMHQIRMGQPWNTLKNTIGIHIINFDLKNQREDYHDVFHVKDNYQYPFAGCLEFHAIQLKKFKKSIKEIENEIDKWAYFLKNVKEYKKSDLPDMFIKDPELKDACDVLERVASSKEHMAIYDKFDRSLIELDDVAETCRNEGLLEGQKKGQLEGQKKGQHNLLIRLIRRKFGDIPPEFLSTIEQSEEEQLLDMTYRILEVKTLEELFDGLNDKNTTQIVEGSSLN